jgi:hypothetical protein
MNIVQNKPIKYGILIFCFFVLNKKVDKKAIGMIHKALANLTVVAISSACDPYLLAAPTTELVSTAIKHHIQIEFVINSDSRQ